MTLTEPGPQGLPHGRREKPAKFLKEYPMSKNSSRIPGRHALHIPGPSPIPDRILRAMDTPIIDHRGPEFSRLARRCLDGIKTIFKTTNPVIIYTATGTGAWEAALVNTLSAGDRILMVETGQFATLWKKMAEKLGLKPEFIETDWRTGADPKAIEAKLRDDKAKEIKAVCVLHNETATGCLSPIQEIRNAIDAAGHPALLMVDTISSLASTDYRHDEWGVDVTVGGAQKGLMLPPGMSFNAVSDKALSAAKGSSLPKSFWSWEDMLAMNKIGFFPYTPATQMLQGLAVAVEMLHEEGLDNVFARHDRLAEATRRAVRGWGLEIMCRDPNYYSPTITAVLIPDGHDADAFRNLALDTFNISYGMSFGRFAGKMFRIGHLGDMNETMLIGALGATEMGLALAGIPHKKGGVQAAMDYLVSAIGSPARVAAE
jgi:alanine-glyoxylate transaminase / serine-glyoxylate transaminase / serine-pyruvate transaminase